jgi:predicted small lipoprotein YifL
MKKNIFLQLLLIILILNSCGKKGPLEELPDRKKPKFDNVIDE